MPPTATFPRQRPDGSDRPHQPGDAAVRVVYQAVRTLVPEEDVVALSELTAATRLDTDQACAAMNSVARRGPFAVSRLKHASEPTWDVRRTDAGDDR